MIRFYCPECRHNFPEDFDVCPDCGFKIKEFYEKSDYMIKLTNALKSPVPEIPVNAAMLLGKIKDARAVEPLIDCIKNTSDVFIILESARALEKIGTKKAISFLRTLKKHKAKMIRDEIFNFFNRIDTH